MTIQNTETCREKLIGRNLSGVGRETDEVDELLSQIKEFEDDIQGQKHPSDI